jgi:hypothetical protein
MAIVEFNIDKFRAQRPEFVVLTDIQLEGNFEQACLFVDNSDNSPIAYNPPTIVLRETYLFFGTCHFATLALWQMKGQSGPIASASEGSVSASFSIPTKPDGAFWTQTPCGQILWMLMQRFVRGGIYIGKKRQHPWG